MLQELLTMLLQAVITVAVPILSAYGVKWLQTKTAETATKTDNAKTRAYLQEATDAISTAVAYTSQTYVDTLKESNSFTAENQKEALTKAKDKALSLLSQSAIDFLDMVYNDATEYLTTKIEQEVRLQKEGVALLSQAIEIIEE